MSRAQQRYTDGGGQSKRVYHQGQSDNALAHATILITEPTVCSAYGHRIIPAPGHAPTDVHAYSKDGSVPPPGNWPSHARAGRSLLFNAQRYYEEKELK